MRRLLPALALLVLLAGCGSSDGDGGGGTAATLAPGTPIEMKSLRFKPENVQVPVGQEITWHNDESVPHDVKANEGASFSSKTFGKDGTYNWTPDKAGTVKYECTLHPGMEGEIEVVAK
jgi:plastocyanin